VSVLQSAWNFLRWNQQPPRIEQRDVFGVRPLSHQLNRPVWPEENVQTYHDQGYAKLALLFRCIGLLAQSVASAPLAVYQQTIQGDDIIENHPIRQLLVNPNRESNEARMMGQIVMTMSIAGFCVVEKERSTGGRVVGLWPLNPSYCRPIQRQDALPDWEIRVPGYEPVVLQSQDVIALTYADKPNRDPTGIGPMKVLLRETALMNVQTDFLKAFFDSGAMPVYGLVPHPDVASTMTQAQADVIREGWRQRYGGMRGAVEPAVLAGITDVKRLSFDFNELAWNDLRDLQELAICQAFGIPPILVGTRYGLERSTYANYGEARRSFYEDTISPIWNRIEDAFARSLLPDFEQRPGYSLHFDTSDVPAMRDDIMPRRQWAVTALQAGALSTHQFYRECELEPAGPDVFLRSFATVEVPVNGVRPQPPAAITPADDEDEEDDELLALPRSRRALADGGMERRATIAQTNRGAYLRVAERHEPAIKQYLTEQRERVLDAATRAQGGIYETRDVNAIDWSEEERILAAILEKLHIANGELAYQLAAEALGGSAFISWELTNPRIIDLLTELASRVVDITETTRLDISRVVTEALTEGVSMDTLAERLTGLYDETYNGRSMTIARTESQVAYNRAAAAGYQDGGVRSVQLFDNPLHDEDYGASDGLSCAERNGLIVPLEEADLHIDAEHPNGTLAIGPVVDVNAP
jgi:HK97 family phage portal protein